MILVHLENIANWFGGWSRDEVRNMSVRERRYWNERAAKNLTDRNEAMNRVRGGRV